MHSVYYMNVACFISRKNSWTYSGIRVKRNGVRSFLKLHYDEIISKKVRKCQKQITLFSIPRKKMLERNKGMTFIHFFEEITTRHVIQFWDHLTFNIYPKHFDRNSHWTSKIVWPHCVKYSNHVTSSRPIKRSNLNKLH